MTLDHLSTTLKAIQADKVDYLIAEGLAVIAHGHSRVTHDLDLVIAMNPENTTRAIHSLSRLGFIPRLPVSANDFCNPKIRHNWIEEKGLQVFSMINEEMNGFVLDLFAEEPFNFEKEYREAAFIELPGFKTALPFVNKKTLIQMKTTAGRKIDLDDIEHLEAI